MSPLLREAVSKEDWERMDRGLSPLPKVKIIKPEPVEPEIENEIKFSDIPLNEFDKVIYNQRSIQNKEGFNFIGFDVNISLKPIKRGRGRPSFASLKEEVGPRSISGWMREGEWNKLMLGSREVQLKAGKTAD